MWRSFLFFFLCISSSLLAYSDWEEQRSSENNLISYGGMKFYCRLGCGNPDFDASAAYIQYLFAYWLPKPLSCAPYSEWDSRYIKRLGLSKWNGGTLSYLHLDYDFSDREFEESHESFLELSANILGSIQRGIADREAEVKNHKKNILTILDYKKLGCKFVEFTYDREEIFGYERGDFLNPDLIKIDIALEQEKEWVRCFEDYIEDYEHYRDYAETTFRLIDSYYREIFTFCLQNHQPEGIAFHAALTDFLAHNLDDALDQIQYLLQLAEEKNWEEEILAKLAFLKGQLENEVCLYADAIIDLTQSIRKDPQNKEAYLERARAYFEVGQFEEAFNDFISSGFRSTPIDSTDLDRYAFASGLMTGVYQGALEGATEFIPSMVASMKTLGSGLWALTKDPMGVSEEIVQAVRGLFESIHSIEDLGQMFIPELREMVGKWKGYSSNKKGEVCGYIIGKYGIDILLTLGTAKGVKFYADLRKASTILTLEQSLKSEKNAAVIVEAAKELQLSREPLHFLSASSRLKNADNAVVEKRKILNYALSNSGKNKGFREILGYNESNWEDLKKILKDGVRKSPAKYHGTDEWGVKFTVDIFVKGPKGKSNVRTGWIYDVGYDYPRLTTLYLHND